MLGLIKWGNPAAFYLLIFLVLWVGVYFYFEKKSEEVLNKKFGPKITPWLRSNVSFEKRRFQFFIQIFGTIFLILALARPQIGQSEQEVKSEGVELLILADVSESMLAEDIKPSRLEAMKIDLTKLIDLIPGHKMGLIAFAGSAALMTPLTSDPSAIKMYVQSLDTFSVSTQGTSFETALSYAKEAFDKGGVTQSRDLKSTRVILLVSDGEDQEQGALEASEKLFKEGIRIITVAYGTENGGTIPTRDRFGNLTGSKKDNTGNIIKTQVKGLFLKELSQKGQGSFYLAEFNGDHIKQIASDIDQFEKAQFESSMVIEYDEKFTYPLLLGLIILLCSLFINDRKKESLVWRGRYEI